MLVSTIQALSECLNASVTKPKSPAIASLAAH